MKIHTSDATGDKSMCGRSLIVKSRKKLGFSVLRVVSLRVFNTVISDDQRCTACVAALDRFGISSNFFKHQAQFAVVSGIAADSRCGD